MSAEQEKPRILYDCSKSKQHFKQTFAFWPFYTKCAKPIDSIEEIIN